jgi:hypothetical protein
MTAPRVAIDVWAQPAGSNFFNLAPETLRLLEISGKGNEQLFSALKTGSVKWTPKALLKLMDQANMDRMMLSAWSRPGCYPLTNEEIYEFVKYNPQRFFGVAAVNLADPVAAVKELEKCVKEYGFKAVRVVPWMWKLPPNDKLYYPLFVKCIELDVPFCCQVGHTGPLMPSETGRPIPYIDEVALTFPQLKIIGGHLGYPWTEEMIAVCWKHPNVYIDTSAYDPKYFPPALVHYMKTYGSDKVMFGTNFPQLNLEKTLKNVDVLGLSQEVKDKFLWRNACNVFKLEPPMATSKL